MDMQEPEDQRLEEESMEPAEEVSEPSDVPALSNSAASEPEVEPAPAVPAIGDTAEDSDNRAAEEEPVLDPSSVDEVEAKSDKESVADESIDEAKLAFAENKTVEASAPDASLDDISESETGKEPVVEEAETVLADEEPESESKPADDSSAWFVVHCYSGYENKVRHNLEQRIETMGMKDMIFDVVVPTQEEIEVRDGKRRTVERHIFPGYVLVNMTLTEESWYVVRNTPGVTGFVGMGNNPTPLRPEEVAQIVKRMEADAPTVKVTFKVGERVRIIDGPFNDFRGVVSEIDMERTKVRVMVSFFGRETPVELDFLQVEKA